MNNQKKWVFIFAGEPSGDMHGSRLIRHLKEKAPHLSLSGVAGPHMRQEGVKGPLNMEDFEVMGFSDVIKALPKLINHFYCIRNTILNTQPDGVVLIDYPGFNLRLAAALRKKGYRGKIIQYISPSVWAWGKHRIDQMERSLDLLLMIYPFEAELFAGRKLTVDYAGTPLKEYIHHHYYKLQWKQILSIPEELPLIALFPGSRKGEIMRNLPILLEAAALLKQDGIQAAFAVSCFSKTTHDLLDQLLSRFPILKETIYRVPREYTYELMKDAKCAMAKSGTTILELALHHCPTVVVYQLSWLNRLYAKYLLKVNLPHYSIVNILAQREVFPELIEQGLNAENLYRHAKSLFQEGDQRKACLLACKHLSHTLGGNDANNKAAESILKVLKC